MKRIRLQIAGSEKEPFDLCLMPGVTAGEVLTALHLEDYALSTHDRYLAGEDDVYALLSDGDRIFAITLLGVY